MAKRLEQQFADAIRAKLGPRLQRLLLFGSRARGDAHEGSDYDILIVVDQRSRELREEVLDVEVEFMQRYGALFASIIRSVDEWHMTERLPLGIKIAREGISL